MTKLTKLEFCTPKPHYKSTASFKNDKGQEFIISVSGDELAAVEEHIQNLNAHFEILPDESENTLQETNLKPDEETSQTDSSEENPVIEETIESQSTSIVEVAFKVANIENITKPSMLKFRLNSVERVPINEGESQRTIKTNYKLEIGDKISVAVSRGKVKFVLFQKTDSGTSALDTQEVKAKKKANFDTIKVIPGSNFYIEATGIDTINEYEVLGEISILNKKIS
ncbi:hypothetical protein Cylst_5897 [Cylindrospermum stagnale PCC 7417]|uniref:Uncharacterized protein n=1 Tax=Cylindrospermum stagnale PCC 7417 TaxID=56107 RepID=K9X6Z4_9NOST|nr:hypothetical protein [Cylindrospermum stagnale]AFZ27874.1 hypothetical protein Cylst_5897 [Cylindrospermum stagnale PCC 7417]